MIIEEGKSKSIGKVIAFLVYRKKLLFNGSPAYIQELIHTKVIEYTYPKLSKRLQTSFYKHYKWLSLQEWMASRFVLMLLNDKSWFHQNNPCQNFLCTIFLVKTCAAHARVLPELILRDTFWKNHFFRYVVDVSNRKNASKNFLPKPSFWSLGPLNLV